MRHGASHLRRKIVDRLAGTAKPTSMSENRDAKIGARVRALRKAAGLSMKDLAERLDGVHFTTIGKLETGKMKFSGDWIQSMAEALQTTAGALVNDRFSPDAVRMTPLYNGCHMGYEKEAFSDAIASAHVPVLAAGNRCFSVMVPDTEPNPNFSFGHWYMTIDPDQRHMVDGGLYAIRLNDTQAVSFVAFSVASASIIAWPSGVTESFGERAFQVIGQVVYQSRAIFPAAGNHKIGFDQFLASYSGSR